MRRRRRPRLSTWNVVVDLWVVAEDEDEAVKMVEEALTRYDDVEDFEIVDVEQS